MHTSESSAERICKLMVPGFSYKPDDFIDWIGKSTAANLMHEMSLEGGVLSLVCPPNKFKSRRAYVSDKQVQMFGYDDIDTIRR